MIFVTKGGMSLYPLFFCWSTLATVEIKESTSRDLTGRALSVVGWFHSDNRVTAGLWWWNLLTKKNEIWETDKIGCADGAFPYKYELLRAQWNFQFSGIYNRHCHCFFCMNCTNLTKMPEKNPICFSKNRPLVCQNVFQSSDLCEVKCLTRSQVSPLYIMQASSTYRCLVCDDDMYSSFFFGKK